MHRLAVPERDIDFQLLVLAYRNVRPMLFVNVATTFGATIVLSNHGLHWGWYFFALTVITTIFRLAAWGRFQVAKEAIAEFDHETIAHWTRIYAIGLYIAGALWIVIIYLGIRVAPQDVKYTLVIIISALAGGATGVTAPMKYVGRIYITVLLLPTSLTMALSTSGDIVIAVLGLIFWVVMLISHNANYKVLRESLVLRAENSQLIHSLKEMNASLESKVAERVQDIKRIAYRDSLTDLPNRRGLMEWMERNLNPAAKHEAAVLFLDLDQFKEINDAMGHDIGDQVLQLVALRFKRCLPKNSILARWGGDEFVIVVAADEQVRYTTEVLAHLLIQAAEAPLEIEGEHMAIGLSVGIAYYPSNAKDFKDIIHAADLAVAEAKRMGNGQILVFNETFAETQRYRFDLSRALGEAIGADRLALAYQPIVEAATGHIAALEALARWYHPVLGAISPEQFVRLAEETDRIVDLGDWVLRKACENAITWVHSEHIPKVAVNVSVKQLLADDFIPRVEQILRQSGLPAGRLELEVTESLFNDENMSIVLSAVKALRTIGIQVHIDDFGTGYSSLSRLHQFPVSAIKIDRSFVAEMHRQGRVIIESTVLIACSFDFKVIAEGVETLEQARSLYAMGIDYFQGYYFSRPMQEARLEKYLPDWHDTIVS